MSLRWIAGVFLLMCVARACLHLWLLATATYPREVCKRTQEGDAFNVLTYAAMAACIAWALWVGP